MEICNMLPSFNRKKTKKQTSFNQNNNKSLQLDIKRYKNKTFVYFNKLKLLKHC